MRGLELPVYLRQYADSPEFGVAQWRAGCKWRHVAVLGITNGLPQNICGARGTSFAQVGVARFLLSGTAKRFPARSGGALFTVETANHPIVWPPVQWSVPGVRVAAVALWRCISCTDLDCDGLRGWALVQPRDRASNSAPMLAWPSSCFGTRLWLRPSFPGPALDAVLFTTLQVNVPKERRTFCASQKCRKHTVHKVTQYKAGKASGFAQGTCPSHAVVKVTA